MNLEPPWAAMPTPKEAAAGNPKPRAKSRTPRKATAGPKSAKDDAAEIDERIAGIADWRGTTLGEVRRLIRAALPDVTEEVKWRKPSNGMAGVPTWSRNGLLCTGEVYKDKVKVTFAHGASLPDPEGLFNAKDTGATRRAIDLRESDPLDAAAFKALVRAAAARNG